MLGTDYAHQTCSIARALEVVGERWTLLVLRDVFLGITRFDALVESLGVTRTVLTHRLQHLVAEDVLERHRYHERPARYEYRPTAKGQELMGVIGLLMQWGDRHYPEPAGPPRLLVHSACGGPAGPALTCAHCGRPLEATEVDTVPGPGLAPA
jgi:DNA-binding HxlR family transcriptional regulator